MWKNKWDKDTSINSIKVKRSCIDINLGFMVQLQKWEEFLKISSRKSFQSKEIIESLEDRFSELKFFKFENSGNITLMDKSELTLFKENEFNHNTFSVILILHEGKLYKLITHNDLLSESEYSRTILSKVDRFIHLLQTYENYPKNCESMYIDTIMLNKNLFNYNMEDIIKYCY
jgi:hypothetical protein